MHLIPCVTLWEQMETRLYVNRGVQQLIWTSTRARQVQTLWADARHPACPQCALRWACARSHSSAWLSLNQANRQDTQLKICLIWPARSLGLGMRVEGLQKAQHFYGLEGIVFTDGATLTYFNWHLLGSGNFAWSWRVCACWFRRSMNTRSYTQQSKTLAGELVASCGFLHNQVKVKGTKQVNTAHAQVSWTKTNKPTKTHKVADTLKKANTILVLILCVCACVYVYYLCVCVYVQVYVYTYACMHVCVSMCVYNFVESAYVCVCMYIHTSFSSCFSLCSKNKFYMK